MKAKLFALFLLCSAIGKAELTYKLNEAIQKKLVQVNFTGAKPDTSFHGEYSSHYGPCMSLSITSSSNDALTLNMEYGYALVPEDSSLQTMLVTQTLIVKLQPKQKKRYAVYAMCTEATNGSPSSDENFVMGKRASGNLLGLAELINRKKYQGNASQDAVWCLTDNHSMKSIYSDDTTMMYDLRRFIAKAKNLPLSSIYDIAENFEIQPRQPTYTVTTTYSGTLSYNVLRSSKVMIALFDEDNHMKKVYVNNETQREGQYTYNYEISSSEMGNKKYYLRMFRDGKLEEEISILPRE